MTIKELKELIHDIPDEAEVYIADEDCGEEVKATDVYYSLKGTMFQYKQSVTDKSQIKVVGRYTGLTLKHILRQNMRL